tara:strand:+ start:1468 stop:2055 length:588 start_codon:yes stop_codon:yes gene_type:complete
MEFLNKLGIPYKLNRKKSRTISLRIDENGLRINAGQQFTENIIYDFVSKKQHWIQNTWKKYTHVQDEIMYLGEIQDENFVKKYKNLEKFYRKEIKRIVQGLVELHNPDNIHGINKIFIKGQKTRWGSCSANGNLNFNWRLAMAPPEVIEYVVIHELCHRIEMNHSKNFWKLVQEKCPEFKKHKAWLKRNGFRLSV